MHPVPPLPAKGTPLGPAKPSADVLSFLASRRSCPVRNLSAPGPTRDELSQILRLATRVPDHRCLSPWRFIVFEADARQRIGEKFALRYQELYTGATKEELARERTRFTASPVVIAVISSPDTGHKTPVWEQELSTGALCYNLLLTATAVGWAGCWLTQWMAFDACCAKVIGLQEHEKIAGFIHLGTAKEPVPERPRPELNTLLSYW